MLKKLIVPGLILQLLLPSSLYSQTRSAFSGDPAKFTAELKTYMGPNLNPEQLANLNSFIARWDSAAYKQQTASAILDISSQLSSRSMRPVPHFHNFLKTINFFTDEVKSQESFDTWLKGLGEYTFNRAFTNDNIDRFLRNTSLMITDNLLYESNTVRWKVTGSDLKFLHDTAFFIGITDATLTCYVQKDSTLIHNVTGSYFPDKQIFFGKSGTITWEKAGYPKEDVYARVQDFQINMSRGSFTIDSARFHHSVYFKEPVEGVLSDQATGFSSKEKANFPKFSTYTSKFRIKDIYKGVDYEGGLAFEGAFVKGTGENYRPARLQMFRNDTLYLKVQSKEFLFSKENISSQETSLTLYLDKDSIFHTHLGFSYLTPARQVNFFRTSNPISKSPYFNSFHNIDMYFEYLSWNMNESKLTLSRARGASIGQAKFESSSFFVNEYFFRLMGMDEYHPLNRLLKFAEWYYSETFPVMEFAKWLNRPLESVTGLCIDMANKGFVYYDRTNNEVTIKNKTKDFLDFFAKKKDYDVLSILSETKSPVDNASLDLKDFSLTINGVKGVFLSDSQRVAIVPYNQQLVLRKNRDIQFDGVVEAGLFTIYGHNFAFSYDTFKIRLQKIDSIRIAVETEERNQYGRPLVKEVENLIQLGTAELYIDKPDNKSGLRSFKQYPIINAVTYSYIFYDNIPGLEGIYKQKDFYFRVDPFTYENIDHYSQDEMSLSGEFIGGNILKPIRQYLTIQEDNSLGFNMTVPEEGIEVYGNKGRIYNSLRMSNDGLVGEGTLRRLTSVTRSDKFRFFPDSMLAQASSFKIDEDPSGIFPSLNSEDVEITWNTKNDEWLASNSKGKPFDMFANGTTLDGNLLMTPKKISGTGIISMTDSRITSNLYNFTAHAIKADTADYNITSRNSSGYAFIAENANTDINFMEKLSRFRLNTDSSVVKFPEVQYICTMTDFVYNMDTRILSMEQKGRSNTPLLSRDELLKVNLKNLSKPTFFSTNNLTDTVKFSAWKGSYNVDKEIIEAENINYIPVADALIQPEGGKITISRRARIQPLQNAILAINNRHVLHSARVDIENTKRYTGSAIYDYLDENNDIQQIPFPELMVDTLTTSATGHIPVSQKFMLSPAFSFAGDVKLNAREDHLTFTGAAGIKSDCAGLTSYSVKFKAVIDPENVLIPISDKPRDINDNMVFSGSFINTDSIQIYPAFLSAQKSWTDVPLVNASGFLWYEKPKNRYLIAPLAKIGDQALPGNMIAFDRGFCVLSGEGNVNFGAKYDLVRLSSAGRVNHTLDSGKVNIQAILALDFFFSDEALRFMADELRMVPSLKAVNLNTELNNKGMNDLLGSAAAGKLKEEMDLFGSSKNIPKEFNYELLLNDVNLYWNPSTSSFRSTGKIGLGYVGAQPINVYVDGFIEIQRRRSGDMVDIYLKANDGTWYYFSYFRGVMMTQAANVGYNSIITGVKANDRKHPDSSVRVPYSYMIAVEDRLTRFLRRMENNSPDDQAFNP